MVISYENCTAFFQQALSGALEEGLFFSLLSDRARGEERRACKRGWYGGEGGGRTQTPQISHRIGLGEEILT